jgi:parallel beta-helix repeat protein
MKKSTSLLVLLLFLSVVFVSLPQIGTVKAEARTIVVPDDYSTIVAAIGNASEGDIIFVREVRTYNETIIIDKPLSLIGENNRTKLIGWAHIQPYTSGWLHPVIQIEADDVKISGFTIYYSHFGITGSGDRGQILGNNLEEIGINLGGSYNTISENNITGAPGIDVSGSFNTIIGNNLIRSGQGIDVTGSSNTISGNNVTDADVGIEVNGDSNIIFDNIVREGGVGIELETGSGNTVYGNIIIENWFMGIHLSTTFDNIIYENYIANNVYEHDGYGVSLSGRGYHAENNTFYRNTFMNNSCHFRIEAPYYVNYWDNGEEGNYWDDYENRYPDATITDGIWNTPYVIDDNNQDNYPLVKPAIIPEFPSWIILPLLIALTFAAIFYKKRLPKTQATNRNHSY